MPQSTLTLEQRVAAYASDVIRDFENMKAMRILVETHFGRSSERPETSVKTSAQSGRGAVIETGIKKAVLDAVLAAAGDVGRDSVLKKLEREGFRFAAKNSKKSVSDALQILANKRQIVKSGKAPDGRSNLYRKP